MLKIFSPNRSVSPRRIKSKEYNLKLAIDLIEFFTVLVSIFISYFITREFLGYFNYQWKFDLQQFTFFAILIIISWYVLAQLTSMAKLPRTQRYLTLFFHFVRVNFLNLLVLIILKYILNLHTIPLIFIFFLVPISMIITFAIRMITFSKLKIYRTNGHNMRHVLVVADDCSAGIIDKFLSQKDWGFRVDAILSNSLKIKEKYGRDIKIFSGAENLKGIIDNNVIDEVIYSKSKFDENEVNNMMQICNEVGVILRLQSCVSPVDPVYLQMQTGNNTRHLALVDIPSNNIPLIIKTMADIYFSIITLILLSPLFLLISVMIKLESKGPVFFKQERIGLRGRKFKLYKFRTMVSNAEELMRKIKDNNEMDGPAFKMANDPRITRFGKFLRKTGFDEFPQLYNVIFGEMSLIGPRPPLETEVMHYKRWQLRRLSVKPGITCTWQIIPNRNDVKFEKWMQLDLNYIDNWSLNQDVKLLFKTVTRMFLADGR